MSYIWKKMRGALGRQTKKSGCYMTNTEVEMLQEDNKKEKDTQKKEEGKEDEKNRKKTT
jgi:hypothetical protein